jgi:Fic-DOC domain mobile mystery protein B
VGRALKFEYPVGSTPIDPDEAEGLIPTHLSIQAELNAWEQANILKAQDWVFSRKRQDTLTEAFVRRLHKEMFDETWMWAGQYRRSDKTLGVAWYRIPENVLETLQTSAFWLENKTFPLDRIAAELHHKLAKVHPFPNGNGRHTRLMADLLLKNLDQPLFTWGGGDLSTGSKSREAYIAALREADRGNIEPLIAFARS